MRDLKATRPRGVRPPTTTATTRPAITAVILDEPGQPAREFALRPGYSYLVGRGSRADVLIQGDEEVSRAHGSIHFTEGGWRYRDLNSASGSFHGASRITGELLLTDGVVVSLGQRTTLHAVSPGPAKANELPPFASASWAALRAAVEKAGRRAQTVLLIGPSGVGKTTHAREIHERSRLEPQRTFVTGAFVPVNCAGLPNDPVWLASLFKGQVKGSFTGAVDREGILSAVADGTLFLDEIESLAEHGQGFLLDILDRQGNAAPLGQRASAALEVPRFRLVAATKVPLGQSKLRPDLVQRLLDGMQISLPSLRERREDIPAYLARFASTFARTRGQAPEWASRALELLNTWPWPGEVRELQAVAHLLFTEAIERFEEQPAAKFEITEGDVHLVLAARLEAFGGTVDRSNLAPASSGPKPSRALTREDLLVALEEHGGNLERAARSLGIVRNTLKAKLRQFGLRD
jgi:DNA-binding NtrC family response regulator